MTKRTRRSVTSGKLRWAERFYVGAGMAGPADRLAGNRSGAVSNLGMMGGWPQSNPVLDRVAQYTDKLLGDMLRLRRRVYRSEALAALREAGREPSIPLEFRSQCGEDLWLWDLFEGKPDGFFIEVGAS